MLTSCPARITNAHKPNRRAERAFPLWNGVLIDDWCVTYTIVGPILHPSVGLASTAHFEVHQIFCSPICFENRAYFGVHRPQIYI